MDKYGAGNYPFQNVREFTPNSRTNWRSLGKVTCSKVSEQVFLFRAVDGPLSVQLTVLSPTLFRVRFDPSGTSDYSKTNSHAVVNFSPGGTAPQVSVIESSPGRIVVATSALRISVDLDDYRLRVFRGHQLIHDDDAGYNLVYVPGARVSASFKRVAPGSRFCGFGEKAGAALFRDTNTMTQFNFDNLGYSNPFTAVSETPVPPDNGRGALNPSEPLYVSVPFLLEVNPSPGGDFTGDPFACGVFLDNPGQTYFNIQTNDYSNTMWGKYYYGALYGELDTYLMFGADAKAVLGQYTALTGRSPMPPKYVFGYHQGAYGYYDARRLLASAQAYRDARFPIDGLHIDIDLQDNYRIFTHSEIKFPNAAGLFSDLHRKGFKLSTNITPLVHASGFTEKRVVEPYPERDKITSVNGFIFNTRAGGGPNEEYFQLFVGYGTNQRFNPYYAAYPDAFVNSDGAQIMGARGFYPNVGDPEVRRVWGDCYRHLVCDLGIDMIWQDMMSPDCDGRPETPYRTFPQDLMMLDGQDYVPNAVMHNVYGLLVLRATSEGIARLRPDRRGFIVARGGYAGLQRYAALWTGDTNSSWDHFRINLPQVLNLGLSGIPISGCDIGGFCHSTGCVGTTQYPSQRGDIIRFGEPEPELLVRWMQLGAFLPWFRNHYDGYNKAFQEPYAYAQYYGTTTVLDICRKYVELRYRLLQVFYDAMYHWTQTGVPISRPLYLEFPSDLSAYDWSSDELMLGDSILVAPIVSPGAVYRDVYLPANAQWYAFKDNKTRLEAPVDGGQVIKGWYAPLDLVPIYIKAGAIIPTRELEQHVGELAANPLTLNCYPGPDASYTLYLDDGLSRRAETAGAFRQVQVTHQTQPARRVVRLKRLSDNYTPPEQFYFIAVLGSGRPNGVEAGQATLPDVGTPGHLWNAPANSYYWNESIDITFVKLFDDRGELAVSVLT